MELYAPGKAERLVVLRVSDCNGNSAAGRTSMAQSASEQMLRVDAASSLHTRVANECKHEYKGESKGERYEVHTIIVLL